MKRKMICAALSTACLLTLSPAHAQVSDNVVRIGVMNDLSGPFSEIAGPGSVAAARLAVEDFQKTSQAGLKVEVVSASCEASRGCFLTS
jgi:branched-chain amino acid transport system substrate-binding protein